MQKPWSVESWQTMGLASLLVACSVLVSGCEAKGRGDSVSDGGDLSLDTGSATEDVAELDSDVFDGAWMLGGADSIYVLVELVSAAAVLDAGSVI
jgi:hypothetical protein